MAGGYQIPVLGEMKGSDWWGTSLAQGWGKEGSNYLANGSRVPAMPGHVTGRERKGPVRRVASEVTYLYLFW